MRHNDRPAVSAASIDWSLPFVIDCSKDVRLPVQLQRAMAAEAEAAREARAKVCAPSLVK